MVKTYKTINELYRESGYSREHQNIEFDLIDFSEIGSDTKKMLALHRRSFFTVLFFKDQKKGHIKLNMEHHNGLCNALLFQGPEHVFSFLRDEKAKGFIILFKAQFLLPHVKNVLQEFPFFNIVNQNLFHLNENETYTFDHLISSVQSEIKCSQIVKFILLAFLQKCKNLYRQYEKEEGYISRKALIVRRFKQLVNNHFTQSKNVEFYAQLLNITPNYLNEVSKSQTGKTSKSIILDRLLLESQNLLLYSDMDISEISHALNFSEPTHFHKFFKKETGTTPGAFREHKP